MATFQRFEDIMAWQKARVLCKMIHSFTLKEPFCRDFKLVSQIKGSSGSAMDNIAEEEFNEASLVANKVGKLTGALINHLKSSELKGTKFK